MTRGPDQGPFVFCEAFIDTAPRWNGGAPITPGRATRRIHFRFFGRDVYCVPVDPHDVLDAYDRYAGAVFARCVRILRDREAARDVTQEVFVRCHRDRRGLRAGRELLAWLYQVATNLCLNVLRDRRTRREAVSRAATLTDVGAEGPGRLLTSEVLGRFDRRTQELVVYVYLDGMTQAEAAAVAGVSDRTVRSRLSGFLEAARRLLDDSEQEEASDGCVPIRPRAR